MVTNTPQWKLSNLVLLDTLPLSVFASVAFGIFLGWITCIIVGCSNPEAEKSDSGNRCCRLRNWFYETVVKPVVLAVFKGTLQEGCKNVKCATTCCHCDHEKGLKFGDISVKSKRQRATIDFFFIVFYISLLFVVIVFWKTFLFNVTLRVDCIPGQACFLVSENLSYSSLPMDCNANTRQTNCGCDVSSANSTVVLCYELALDYALAAGVASGLFKLTTLIIQITCWFLLWFWKKSSRAWMIVRLSITLLTLGTVIGLSFIPAFYNIIYNITVIRGAQYFAGYLSFELVLLLPFSTILERQKEEQQGSGRQFSNAIAMNRVDGSDNDTPA